MGVVHVSHIISHNILGTFYLDLTSLQLGDNSQYLK